MANFVPNWVGDDSLMTGLNFMSAYTIGANPSLTLGPEPSGQLAMGTDSSLGIGQFMYAQMTNATGCVAGNVVEITPSLYGTTSICVVNGVQQWAGTANTGKTLGVALTALAQNQFGWIQVYGAALVTTNAAVAINASAYWSALGVVQSTAVNSKQMVNAQCVVASSASFGQVVQGVTPALTSTQAVYFINFPHAQSAIM